MAVKLLYDLHTHTVFSHGKGTVEQNILSAIDKGLAKIAITDHGHGHVSYGISKIEEYFEEISAMKRKYADKIEVLSGVELNLCSLKGDHENIEKYRKHMDITLLGYHKFSAMKNVGSYFYYYFTPRRNMVKNTDAVVKAIYNDKIDILTHPGYAMPINIEEVAKACADTDTLFEINNKHSELTPKDIALAAEQGARFIISSDAHASENVGVCDSAIEKFLKSGVPIEYAVNLGE